MSRLRSVRPYLVLALLSGLLALASTPASAAGAPPKPPAPTSSSAAESGRTSLPPGKSACASKHEPKSRTGSCSRTAPSRPVPAAAPYAVSLTGGPVALLPGGTATLVATANQDVGPTPYYIEIFDATSQTFLADCGFGSTCSTSVTQTGSVAHYYVAYISSFGTGYPPPNVQASSNLVALSWTSVRLVTSQVALSPGASATLTAAASLDVGPTPYYIEIFDLTTGSYLTACGAGTTCSVSVSQPASSHAYIAFISGFGTTLAPPNLRATSNGVFITWF
jgi:hypothetical protein